jgi:signal transduction histidine kinase
MPEETTQVLDDAAEKVRESIKSLRTLLVDIYPPKLAEAGLDMALVDLVASVRHRGTAAELDTTGLTDAVPDEAAALVYRGAQEALRNVLAHAQADNVRVRAATEGGRAVLEVVDDGHGFLPDETREALRTGHLGLRGLEDRVRDAGGEFSVGSTPGEGTTLRLEVPIR